MTTDITKIRFVRWSMTVFEGQWSLLSSMPSDVKAWGWQDEICPRTNKAHKQGYIHTRQMTLLQLAKVLPGIHVEPIPYGAKGKNGGDRWQGLLDYCKKEKTRAPGAVPVQLVNPDASISTKDAMLLVAKHLYWQEDETEFPDVNADAPKNEVKYQREAYWRAATMIIISKPHLATQYFQPQMEKGWVKTHKAWRILYWRSINTCPAEAPDLPLKPE